MADYIIHHNGAYNIYGTIADGAHYEGALTLDQLREVLRQKFGDVGAYALPERLARAHKTGCSGIGWSLDDCIAANRQGPNESHLSRDEFIGRFLTPASAWNGRTDTTSPSEHCGGDCISAPCDMCDGTQHKPGVKLSAAKTEAYAEGRADELADCTPLLAWAYGKLHHINFTKQDDALMMDRIKLLLEHGRHG